MIYKCNFSFKLYITVVGRETVKIFIDDVLASEGPFVGGKSYHLTLKLNLYASRSKLQIPANILTCTPTKARLKVTERRP